MLSPKVVDVQQGFLEQIEDIGRTFPSIAYIAPICWVFAEVCLKRSFEEALQYYELEMARLSILSLEVVCSWLIYSLNGLPQIERSLKGLLHCAFEVAFPQYEP